MSMFTNRLRSAAYIAIGSLTLALAHSMDVRGCHPGGCGMGGGYNGGYNMGGSSYPGGGYSYGTGLQNYSSPQQTQPSSPSASLNNPATVLAHEGDLSLTSKQMQALEKMLSSGKQHAALVLTAAQRKQLAGIIGPARRSGSAGASPSPSFGASSIAASP